LAQGIFGSKSAASYPQARLHLRNLDPRMTYIVKNTFIDLAEPEEKALARLVASAPPATWRCPALHSDDSTAASDDESSFSTCVAGPGDAGGMDIGIQSATNNMQSALSDVDMGSASNSCPHMECLNEGSESRASEALPPRSGKVTLCLDATVTSSVGVSARRPQTRLSANAPAFAPAVAATNEEIYTLIESVREVLQASPDVLSVKASDVVMGGTTTVLAEVRSSCPGAAIAQQTLSLLKTVLLDTASESTSTYILGYRSQPFQDADCGFKATVGCVSALQEHSVCWDVYEHGYCARRNCCRWCHPLASDLTQLVVTIKDVHDTQTDEMPAESA